MAEWTRPTKCAASGAPASNSWQYRSVAACWYRNTSGVTGAASDRSKSTNRKARKAPWPSRAAGDTAGWSATRARNTPCAKPPNGAGARSLIAAMVSSLERSSFTNARFVPPLQRGRTPQHTPFIGRPLERQLPHSSDLRRAAWVAVQRILHLCLARAPGFTLVEFGVVLIVTGVTCTVGLPGLRDSLGSHRRRFAAQRSLGRHRLGRAPVPGRVQQR